MVSPWWIDPSAHIYTIPTQQKKMAVKRWFDLMFAPRGVNYEHRYMYRVVRYCDIALLWLGTYIIRFLIKCAPKIAASTR